MCLPATATLLTLKVSVLFSEPKIPQSRFLQNKCVVLFGFQCSSASRKFLNRIVASPTSSSCWRFSALQRAENSSIDRAEPSVDLRSEFQCSSASRKFLNSTVLAFAADARRCFSALQRAENSSMKNPRVGRVSRVRFSALQRAENSSIPPTVRQPR